MIWTNVFEKSHFIVFNKFKRSILIKSSCQQTLKNPMEILFVKLRCFENEHCLPKNIVVLDYNKWRTTISKRNVREMEFREMALWSMSISCIFIFFYGLCLLLYGLCLFFMPCPFFSLVLSRELRSYF